MVVILVAAGVALVVLSLVVLALARRGSRSSKTLPSASTASPEPVRPEFGGGRWKPSKGISWQWQLDGDLDMSVDADVYDVDAFDTDADQVAELHRRGRRVICYLDVGAVESYRPDASKFPADVVGSVVDGWPHEKYLDIRRIDALAPVLLARLDMCEEKGFDGVEGDVVDAYDNDSGFAITADDQVRFLEWFADAVHERGMAAGLKNVPDLVPRVVDRFDFVVAEDCFSQGFCSAYEPFLRRGLPVFDAEYRSSPAKFCEVTTRLGISAIAKRDDLGSWREACR